MESIPSVKIFHGSEFKANGKVIRWTEVPSARSAEQRRGNQATTEISEDKQLKLF